MFSRAAFLRRLAAAPVLRSSPLSTTVKRAPEAAAATEPQQAAKVKRPTEIPFQPEVANTVHLVGTIRMPLELEEKSPGEYEAWSEIAEKKDSVENDSTQLWIPVIFQGDLALIVAGHVKENDLVYIVGQLSGDEATTKVEDAHSKIRIFARELSFVESNSRKAAKMVSEQDKKMASDHSEGLWKDVFENPTKWLDNRLNKRKPRAPDFKHKDSGDSLWLDTSPSWVREKLPPAESH